MQNPLRFFLALLALLLLACDPPKKETAVEAPGEPLDVPPSFLGFRVNFAIQELEKGVNTVLPTVLVDGPIPINGKGDTLFVKVVRKGKLNLALREKVAYASIPLDVYASVKKKVMGITFSNQDNPVKFSGIVKASSHFDLDEQWNMVVDCQWLGFEWQGERPQIAVLGLAFGVDKMIEKAIEANSEQISSAICDGLQRSVDFRKILEKVWMDVQDPIRIAQNPAPIWMVSDPIALNGEIVPHRKDTLSILMELRSVLRITPDKQFKKEKIPLSPRLKPLNEESALLAYPELFVSYDFAAKAIKDLLRGRDLSYEGYRAEVEDVRVSAQGQLLKIELFTKGDLTGKLTVLGVPALTEDMELIIQDFKYELEAEETWISLTNLAAQSFIEEYIRQQMVIDVSGFLNNLPTTIREGIAKTPMGQKMTVDIRFREISPYKFQLTKEGIQWILYVEGKGRIHLKSALFEKGH